ncbi:MAG: Uncharacterized protein LiPW15_316 [Parcubacteria group bacterium LiPW_15]|nr:MAG: Uncharacterized protein LiPW15_316 [Parcubacteria group bacterium LiPW_15]
MLFSVQELFSASEDVTRSEWATFANDVGALNNPAVRAFAYVERVPKAGLPEFISTIRKDEAIFPDGYPNFKIFPEKDKDEYLPIKYVVPVTTSTALAIGFDIAEGQVSVPDMLEARDKDIITSTEDFKVNFINGNGVIVFKAIYGKNLSRNTVEERRAALKGYAVLVFDTQALLSSILPSYPEGYVEVSAYESGSATSSSATYESNPLLKQTAGYAPRFVAYRPYVIGNRTWTLGFYSTPAFDAYMDVRLGPRLLLFGGLLIALLVAAAVYLLMESRVRAVKIANKMTADLREMEEELVRASENRYRTLFLSSRDAVMTLEPPTWNFTSGNPATVEMFKAKDEKEFMSYEPWKLSPEAQPDGRPSMAKAKEMIEQAMREGHNFFEWTHRRIDGQDFPAEVLLSRVDYGKKSFLHALVRDITERKKIEEQLKAYAEERFKIVFDNASDGMVLADLENKKFSDSNGAFSKMLGFSPDEIRKLWINDIHPDEAVSHVLDQFEKLLRKEVDVARDIPIKRKDGGIFYADITSSPVTIGDKKFVLGIFRDITERRRADAALREQTEESQNLNRALMTISEANQVAVQATSEDKLLKDVCNILVKNAGYRMAWVGYAENDENKSVRPMAWAGHTDGYIEKLNISWADTERGRGPTGTAIREKRVVIDPDFSKDPNFGPWFKEARALGYVGSAVVPLLLEGRVFGALNIYSAAADLFNSAEVKMLEELAGDLAFSIASIRTKAEKERVFTELEHTAAELQQFKRAVDNASDHIIITDPDAKIIYVNRGAERTTGYSAKEMIGKTPALWGGQMPKEFYTNMWRVIKTEKKSFTGKVTNRRKSGETYLSEFSISPILSEDGNIIFFVGVERDITKAEEIDRSKSEFVSLASHQLRTPLSAINWYAEMLLGGDAGALNDKQKDYASEIYASSRRMAELVGALLNVSRIELGTFAIEPKPTDIRDIANSVIKELEPKILTKNQVVVSNYSEDVPKLINIDPNLTRMILQNLISNSVKYTPDGGKISIFISKTERDVVVKVLDNGYGIPLNQQERVFEKFFRADNIIPVETDGTGLGLYIVKEIVEKSGGAVSFESEENVGTTFSVTIPISGMKQRTGARSLDG